MVGAELRGAAAVAGSLTCGWLPLGSRSWAARQLEAQQCCLHERAGGRSVLAGLGPSFEAPQSRTGTQWGTGQGCEAESAVCVRTGILVLLLQSCFVCGAACLASECLLGFFPSF